MKDVESAEQGQFFISADGKVTFRDRNYKRTQQFNSQATFGNGSGELPFSDVITTLDDSKIHKYCICHKRWWNRTACSRQ